MIDYDEASSTYDNTRGVDGAVIDLMARRGALGAALSDTAAAPEISEDEPAPHHPRPAGPRVLDFGCGTGNYLRAIRSRFRCELFGLEPSVEMRARAVAKNSGLKIEKGDHSSIPFEDSSFDFIYMTDVIHHVPDLDLLFESLARIMIRGGLACVVTESWAQIEARWYNAYFPSLAGIEKARYPDIGEIERRAGMAGLGRAGTELVDYPGPRAIDEDFLRMVGERNYSMFRLLADAELETGLAVMGTELGRTFITPEAGLTLVWLQKGGEL